MTDFCEIQQLVNLFNPPRDDNSDSDHDENYGGNGASNNIAEKDDAKSEKINPYDKVDVKRREREITELGEDEIVLSQTDEEDANWKKTPKWNITYRQKVTASDVFLQMGAKTPATASCEDMIVTIDLPGEHMQNMDIKVLQENLQVTSPNFTLKIPLPHPVHPQKGDAKWDKDAEKLYITLSMEREFDFINF